MPIGLLFLPALSLALRYESAYHAIMGRQFDAEHSGNFDLFLLYLALIRSA